MSGIKMVYICSPYAGDVEHNVKMAREYCKYAVDQGAAPAAVHLLYPQFMDDSNPADRAKACKMGLRVLSACDACWVFGDRISQGMAVEIAEAERLGIPVSRITIEETLECLSGMKMTM